MRPSRSLVFALIAVGTAVSLTGCFGTGVGRSGSATTVEGALVNEYGHAVRVGTVTAGGATANVSPDGRFRLSGVTPGRQVAAFRAAGYFDRDLEVNVVAGLANRLNDPDTGRDLLLKTFHSLKADRESLEAVVRGAGPHSGPCETCHLSHDSLAPASLKANDQALCEQSGCHTAPDGSAWQHPASHVDSTKVQPVGELAPYSRISCLRCHVSHAKDSSASLTPGFPVALSASAYTAYCTTCHNSGQPGNRYDPATHNPGTDCAGTCHRPNGLTRGHKSCARSEPSCHAASATLPLHAVHKANPDGCAACHDTNAGPTDNKLLKGSGDALCLSACHNTKHDRIVQELIVAGGRSPDPAVQNEYVHNVPCVACHNVHQMGAAPDNLITHPFEQTPWRYPKLAGNQPVSGSTLSGYETDFYFCFSCHGGYKNSDFTQYDGTVLNDARNTARQAWGADWVNNKGAKEVYWNYAFSSNPARTNFKMGPVDMHTSHMSGNYGHPSGYEPVSCESCHGVHTSVQKSLVQNPLAPFVNNPGNYSDVPLHNCIQAATYTSCHYSNCHTAAFWPDL
jgi:predicted CXXCH cytochrome family protein